MAFRDFMSRGLFGDNFGFGQGYGGQPSSTGAGGFDALVAQKLGTGPAQGNGGYATGQSPDELFKKAQVGLLGSQTAENKAQTDRLSWLNNLVTNDPQSFLKMMRGEGAMDAGSFGMKPGAGDNRFIQFPGVGGLTPTRPAPQPSSSYDPFEAFRRY
jgi:hypothetical protein